MGFYTTVPPVLYISAVCVSALLLLFAKRISSYRSQKLSDTKFIQDFTATARALPSSWYRSREIYELERRAIFAKKWIFVSHKLRFSEVGSCEQFKEAGFKFTLVKNNEGVIQGFRNLGKDDAYPVEKSDNEKTNILTSELCDRPQSPLENAAGHNEMKGTHEADNKLPIHVRVDAKGFVWINLDTSKTPEDWSTEFKDIDRMARHESFNFEHYRFDHTWGMSGDYNWKTLADNYNECYHCKTAHPDAASVSDLTAYRVDAKGGNIEHFAKTTTEAEKSGLKIVSNYYFPNACMTVSPNFFYLMRCVPTSETHCSMEYEVYRHKDASHEDFKTIDEMFKRILAEDKWLCNNAQRNLNAGVFINGEMHPKREQGPLYFQHRVRGILTNHHEREKRAGRKIDQAAVPSHTSPIN